MREMGLVGMPSGSVVVLEVRRLRKPAPPPIGVKLSAAALTDDVVDWGAGMFWRVTVGMGAGDVLVAVSAKAVPLLAPKSVSVIKNSATRRCFVRDTNERVAKNHRATRIYMRALP